MGPIIRDIHQALSLSDSISMIKERILSDELSLSDTKSAEVFRDTFVYSDEDYILISDSVSTFTNKAEDPEEPEILEKAISDNLSITDSIDDFTDHIKEEPHSKTVREHLENSFRFEDSIYTYTYRKTGCDLRGVRKQFVTKTGRYDLVKDTNRWIDNGADWFIREGQKLLEGMVEFGSLVTIKEFDVERGQLEVGDTRLNSIFEVFWNGTKLEEKNYKDFFDLDSTLGTPSCYTVAVKRDSGLSSRTQKVVIIKSPPSESGVLAIRGRFGQSLLIKEEDENVWTEKYCGLLVKATMYQLESFYRNTQGQNDLMRSIRLELHGIEADYIEEKTEDISFERD